MSEQQIRHIFADAASAHTAAADMCTAGILAAVAAIGTTLREGGKVLVFGNGGSAADSQHFAAELVGRFQCDRQALAAVALTTDTSVLTSIANDFAYEQVFARQVQALGRPGDVAFGITTSGRSRNVMGAFDEAARRGLTTIALVGSPANGESRARITIAVPAANTARIQEVHRTILHILCELIEKPYATL